MGRIKEISRRSVHARKRNPVVYLICEGSETEIRYFKRFRSRGCNIDITRFLRSIWSVEKRFAKTRSLHRYGADLKGFGISQQAFCNAK